MEPDRNILTRYFLGECTNDEKESIHQWLESNEAHKQQFIRERIRFDASLVIDEEKIATSRPAVRKNILFTTLKIASAILLLVGSSYLFNLYFDRQTEKITQEINVPPGNRSSLTLPDGTLVWLNSNTTLTYPNIFDKETRSVELDGEAYFEVTKNDKKSFIVKTSKFNVEVLGTTFNVEAYSGKPDFEVGLFTGKVRIFKEQEQVNEEIYLKPGQAASLVNGSLWVSTADFNNYRWRDGLIIIEDKSFEEIMSMFEKYYGQQIIIENEKVKDLGYRGKLRIGDGIDHALRVLQNDFRFTYKRDEDNNKIYIY